MYYLRYVQTRDLVWRIMLNENIRAFPVNVIELCRSMGIRVQEYQRIGMSDGFSTIIDGEARIFVAQDCPPERKRFVIAHEMGHILLDHVGKFDLVNLEPMPNDQGIERDANMFACRLLAPACVLWALNIRSAKQMAKMFHLTMEEARYRARRMTILYKRNKFLTSPLERAVFEQLKDYIEKTKATLNPPEHPASDPGLL